MKSIEVKINIYEVGDILDVSGVKAAHRKETLNGAKKALVIQAKELKDGRYHYKCVTDKGNATSIIPEEMIGEKYIGHVDLSLIYELDM